MIEMKLFKRGRSNLSMTPVVGDLKTATSTETLDLKLDPPYASSTSPLASSRKSRSFRKLVGSIRSRSFPKIRSSHSRKNANNVSMETTSTATSNTTAEGDVRVRPVRISVNKKRKEEDSYYGADREKDLLLQRTEDLLSAFDSDAHSTYDASSVVDEPFYTHAQHMYDLYGGSVFDDSTMYGESTLGGESTTVGGESTVGESTVGESSNFGGISALTSIFPDDDESSVNTDNLEDDDTAPTSGSTTRNKKKMKKRQKQPPLCGQNVLLMGLFHIVEDVTICGAYVVKKAEETVCGPQRRRRRRRGRSR